MTAPEAEMCLSRQIGPDVNITTGYAIGAMHLLWANDAMRDALKLHIASLACPIVEEKNGAIAARKEVLQGK